MSEFYAWLASWDSGNSLVTARLPAGIHAWRALRAAVNTVHWRAANVSAGPFGSLESRTATPGLPCATWTQLPLAPLWLLIRHVARDGPAASISRLLSPVHQICSASVISIS